MTRDCDGVLPVSKEPSLQQIIKLAGIVQSKILIEQRHLFKMNDRVILLHQKRFSEESDDR
jgi:hypothetical protein